MIQNSGNQIKLIYFTFYSDDKNALLLLDGLSWQTLAAKIQELRFSICHSIWVN